MFSIWDLIVLGGPLLLLKVVLNTVGGVALEALRRYHGA